MDELKQFKSWLTRAWSPTVAVIVSDEAETNCWECTGLTVAELLHPFGTLNQLNSGMGVPVRTPAEQPIRLYSWTLRFFNSDDMVQPSPEVAEEHLTSFLKSAAATAATSPIPDLQEIISTAGTEDATPWYSLYREEYFRMLRFGEHETQDNPVACILVLPSTIGGDDPSALFAALFERKASDELKQAVAEGQVVMHYMFLHNASSDPEAAKERCSKILQRLPSIHGLAGHVLTINSPGSSRIDPSTWTECVKQRWEGSYASKQQEGKSSPPPSGSGISEIDAAGIAAFAQELAARKVAPHVEGRIRVLDQAVLAARRGIKNQLKTLFFRKPTASSPQQQLQSRGSPRVAAAAATADGAGSPRTSSSTSNGVHYTRSSTEFQMRQLSDLALMVGDCETALANLRLLASDFKSDKAYFHYAGTQDAMAIATVLCDGNPSDAVSNFKEAFYRYQPPPPPQVPQQQAAAHQNGAWYATRTAMLTAAYLACLGRCADASWIVMKAHFQEENLRAALLLEHAAHLLLRVNPPRERKFAFHLVLAGLRYTQGSAQELASRAYFQGLAVYGGRQWEIVEEHVREALGKTCREVGDVTGAVEHFAATLLCPQLPAGLQSLHVAQFAEALKNATEKLGYAPIVDLSLPVIDQRRVTVSSSGQASYANVEARQTLHDTWTLLESAVIPSGGEAAANWLDGGSRANLLGTTEFHSCCVGEDVGVDIELNNPLKIELGITQLRLSCTFEGALAKSAPPASAAADAKPKVETAPFQLREERITLHPGERAIVHLRVRPLRTGQLRIDGVTWCLNSVAIGQKAFTIPRRAPSKKGSRGAALASEEDSGEPVVGGIDVKVMPPMPRLDLSIENLPPTLLAGQVARCVFRLKNVGAMTMHALRAATSGGTVFLEGGNIAVSHKQDVTLFSLKGSKLGVNDSMEVVGYIRPMSPGLFAFNLCLCYEPLVKLEALPFRTLRATFTASVLPSLEVSGVLMPSSGPSESQLLMLRGLNLHGLRTFQLTELILPSSGWRASPAGPSSTPAHQGVMPMNYQLDPESAVAVHVELKKPETSEEAQQQQMSIIERHLQGGGDESSSSGDLQANSQLQLLLRWTAAELPDLPAVQGFSILCVKRDGDAPKMTARFLAPERIPHNFADSPTCIIEANLELCHELPGAVEIRWGTSSAGAAAAAGSLLASATQHLESGRTYVWYGQTSGTVACLNSGASVSIPLKAVVQEPGWVALGGGCWVAWNCKDYPHLSGAMSIPQCHVSVGL